MNQILEQARPATFAPAQSQEPFRPVPCLLGIAFDSLTIAETVTRIDQMIQTGEPHYVVTANVDFLVQARRDVELRRVLLEANLVLCDGTPLLWLARALRCPLPERVAGSDLTPRLITLAEQKGYRVFFLGGAPEVAAQAVVNLRRSHPKLIIAGQYSPPFRPLLEMDQADIAQRIKAAKPDLLLVSFGCPKAEKWLSMNFRSLGVPVGIGIGATIDFLAGQMKRAPRWMQRTGTEWIFRLAQEPRRLLKRYLEDMWVFGQSVPQQLWQFRPQRTDPLSSPRFVQMEEHVSWNYLIAPDHLDRLAVQENAALLERASQSARDWLINMASVKSLDSAGAGLLIWLQKQLQRAGRELVLIAPSAVVQQTLQQLRLEDFFTTAPDTILSGQADHKVPDTEVVVNPQQHTLEWTGEITAENAEAVWLTTSAELGFRMASPQPVVIDLSGVRFMDSAGIGIMVRVRKFAEKHGLKTIFRGANGNVRNVLRLAQLEMHLLERMA